MSASLQAEWNTPGEASLTRGRRARRSLADQALEKACSPKQRNKVDDVLRNYSHVDGGRGHELRVIRMDS